MRLAIRQLPHTDIAQRTGVHRHTVRRVLKRTRAALAINADLSADRAEAIAVYREVQRTAWEAVEKAQERGRSPSRVKHSHRLTSEKGSCTPMEGWR